MALELHWMDTLNAEVNSGSKNINSVKPLNTDNIFDLITKWITYQKICLEQVVSRGLRLMS